MTPSAATMRRVTVRDDGVHVDTVPVPAPASGEALVATTVAGVCGSDVHASHGRHPFVPLPYLPGHEIVGVVEQVADDVESVTVGDRVVVEPTLPCWSCTMCTTGRENLCENLRFFGCGYSQGGMADLFTVPAGRLHRVPDSLTLRQAALIEPLSTPVHAARLAGGLRGKSVAILGAGTIGLLVLAVARAQDASRTVVTDVLPAKRDRAARLGADVVLDAAAPDVAGQVRDALGRSADVVFDCVSIQATVSTAITVADKGGTVVIVGVPAADVVVPLPIVQDHQIRIQGSATYLPEDYAESIDMLSAGAVDPDEIITAVLPVDQVAAAFQLAAGGEHVKVLVSDAAD